MQENIFKISGVNVNITGYKELLERILHELQSSRSEPFTITYCNANTVNSVFRSTNLQDMLKSFDVIHPDGAGIYFASKFLEPGHGLKTRMTGSDLYPALAGLLLENGSRVYFFGHDDETLGLIKKENPGLNIAGMHNGYKYNTDTLIQEINNCNTELLVIGLGFVKQEKWICENRGKLKCKVIIASGDGLKVFAGTKTRGPVFLRKIGLEWLTRLFFNPLKYFKRYIIGNPLFLYRIILIKMRNLPR